MTPFSLSYHSVYQQRVMQPGYPIQNSVVGGPMNGGGGIPPRYTGQPTMMTGVQGMGVRGEFREGFSLVSDHFHNVHAN